MSCRSTMCKLKEELPKMVPPTSSAQIALSALILGKAVLVAGMLPTITRCPEKPLAYTWRGRRSCTSPWPR